MKIINALKHFRKVIIHKWWVFYYCCKVGIPFQGLIHDLSKFSLVEFAESVKYYCGTDSPINACKKENGYSNAWLHHKGRNKHHYEYWQDNFDKGGESLEMPMKYTLEMLCDYYGAGRAYSGKGGNDLYESEYLWWQKKKSNGIAMHENTLKIMDKWISLIKIEGDVAFKGIKREYKRYRKLQK